MKNVLHDGASVFGSVAGLKKNLYKNLHNFTKKIIQVIPVMLKK